MTTPPLPSDIALATDAIVIGAGLSGASCARHLAESGLRVCVLERGDSAAAGASGLPVGLVVPHTSADDTRLSQISRIGIAHTLYRAATLLQHGTDWGQTGVVEHCVEGRIKLPHQWADAPTPSIDGADNASATYATTPPALHRAVNRAAKVDSVSDSAAASTDFSYTTQPSASQPHPADIATTPHHPARYWSQVANAAHLARAALPADTAAIWHHCAAWIKPPALIAALLHHPNISLHTHAHVARLTRAPSASPVPEHIPSGTDTQPPIWHVHDAHGRVLASAPIVVLAAGFDSAALLADTAAAEPHGTHIDTPSICTTSQQKRRKQPDTPSHHTAAIPTLPLNALRGQIAWGWLHHPAQAHKPHIPSPSISIISHDGMSQKADTPSNDSTPSGLPDLPVNGKGSMACHIPYVYAGRAGHIWICGSTFDRGDTCSDVRAHDMPTIWRKLHVLHASAAYALRPAFAPYLTDAAASLQQPDTPTLQAVASASDAVVDGADTASAQNASIPHATAGASGLSEGLLAPHPSAAPALEAAQGWAGVRATLPDRLPAVGAWPGLPGVHVCCGMGARGLALSMLAGRMLVQQICPHAQPDTPYLPDLPPHLAAMLDAQRWLYKGGRAAVQHGNIC